MRTKLLITLLILFAIVTCMLMIRVERAFLLGNTTTTTQASTGNATTTRAPTGNTTTTTQAPTGNTTTTTRASSACDPNAYTEHDKIRYGGNTLRDIINHFDGDVNTCKEWCNLNRECGAFNKNGSKCYFKRKSFPRESGLGLPNVPGTKTYLKPACVWGTREEYDNHQVELQNEDPCRGKEWKYTRADYDGDPIESKQMAMYSECTRWCDENPECGGFDMTRNLPGYRTYVPPWTCHFKKVKKPYNLGSSTRDEKYMKPSCWKGWL